MVGVEADEVRGAGLGVVVKEGGGGGGVATGRYITPLNKSSQDSMDMPACLPANNDIIPHWKKTTQCITPLEGVKGRERGRERRECTRQGLCGD